jgi:Flp pilus assembly protein TadG
VAARRREDDGQAVPLLAGVLALLVAVLLGLVALGNLVGERTRAQTAADAAALAGAARGRPAAEALAIENDGTLERYASEGAEVEVTVRVGDARATSRARREW